MGSRFCGFNKRGCEGSDFLFFFFRLHASPVGMSRNFSLRQICGLRVIPIFNTVSYRGDGFTKFRNCHVTFFPCGHSMTFGGKKIKNQKKSRWHL